MDEATREGILNRIKESLVEMKDSLNLLMSGEMLAENQKGIAEAVKKVYGKTEKGIPKAARPLIDSLMGGSCSKDNVGSLVPRTIGTIWEVLLIGQIQLIIDANYPEHILEIGVSPDLPGLDVDVKSTSKEDGEGTSASSKGNTVIDLGRMRILGLDYDVLYIRYEEDSIKRLEFIGREEFADAYCYNLMKGATEAMLEEDGLGDKEREFLLCLAGYLTLKKNPKGSDDDPRIILDWILNSIIREDIAHRDKDASEGMVQAWMKTLIRMGIEINEQLDMPEATKKELKKLMGGMKLGTKLEDTQSSFRELFPLHAILSYADWIYRGELGAELGNLPPESSSRKARLLWLTPIIRLLLTRATTFGDSEIDRFISHFTSEVKPKFAAGTKSYELVLNFAQKDEKE